MGMMKTYGLIYRGHEVWSTRMSTTALHEDGLDQVNIMAS